VVWLLNDGSQILPRPTLVAMATTFGSKSAITQLVCEISPRSLRPTGGLRGRAIERCQLNSTTTDPCILITLVGFAELLTDFSYTNFTVGLSNVDALNRLRVHLNIILFTVAIPTESQE